MKKTYRTSQGKTIDLGALQLQNEGTRAVGNMGVNARGDKVNPQNTVSESRNSTINRYYKKQTKTNVVDDVVVDSQPNTKKQKQKQKNKQEPVAQPAVIKDELAETVQEPEMEETVEDTKSKKLGGLAGAIARAKNIKQEPLKTPRQLAQEKNGVKKI